MLRDKNLVPLSHQHQHALALCVRIQRHLQSGIPELARWQVEILEQFETEIDLHFEAEERFIFPVAARFTELEILISELFAEHTVLRAYRLAAMARSMERADLLDFAATLSNHVRKEEVELFEKCQQLFSEADLNEVGSNLREFLRTRGDVNDFSTSAGN